MKNLLLYTVIFLLLLLSHHQSYAGISDSVIVPVDEFISVDSLQEFKRDSGTAVMPLAILPGSHKQKKEMREGLYWTLLILFFTILSGFLVRFKYANYLRSLFLVLSLVILGFYRGACPCPISSLQHTALIIFGNPVQWNSVLLFLGLIPVTYLFGRVFCGWICQLGALQEFIFASPGFKVLQSYKTQQIMRRIRLIAFVTLIIQISITQTNLFKRIDPFAAIYNFYAPSVTGWILAGILIISSVFIYRPFCKTICPIGLLLGWISKIPGASVLGTRANCISCTNCSNNCKIRAVTHDNGISVLQNEECIRCGACINGCKRNALSFFLNSKKHRSESTSTPFTKKIKS